MKKFSVILSLIFSMFLLISCGVDDIEDAVAGSACETPDTFKCDSNVLLKCEDYTWEKIKKCSDDKICNATKGTCEETGENNGDNSDNNDNGENANSGYCGNNIVEAGELCDGNAKECTAIDTGFSGGYAVCRTDCQGYDTTGCTGTPANTDPGDNSGTNPGDNSGTNPGNGGNPPDNGGNPPDNGGNPPDNGGNPPDNGGNPPDNGGNDTPATGCKEITLGTKLTYDEDMMTDFEIPAYYTSYTIDGQKKERFGIELKHISDKDEDINGIYDDFSNTNYGDEGILDLIIYENWDGSDATGYYFQRGNVDEMKVEISGYNSVTHRITVKFTNVILEKVTIPGLDNGDFTSNPVPNGECLKVKDTTVSY